MIGANWSPKRASANASVANVPKESDLAMQARDVATSSSYAWVRPSWIRPRNSIDVWKNYDFLVSLILAALSNR
jgi:hypothetical protein